MTDATDGEYDEFLDALAEGQGYYYVCSNGHELVPPRQVCPRCGDRDLEREPLPETGEIVTHTTVAVPAPRFENEVPYVTAVAAVGPVRLTGMVRGVDPDDVAVGQDVTVTVESSETAEDRTIVFRP